MHTQFNNRWWLHAGGTIGIGQTYCDRNCTRGGPALKQEAFIAPWAGIEGNYSNPFTPSVFFNYFRGDGGRSYNWNISPSIRYNVSSRFSTSLSFNYRYNRDDTQFFGNFTDTLALGFTTSLTSL